MGTLFPFMYTFSLFHMDLMKSKFDNTMKQIYFKNVESEDKIKKVMKMMKILN